MPHISVFRSHSLRSQAVELSGSCVKDLQFVEFSDPVFGKKFYKLDHLGPICRILQTDILQTGPNSIVKTAATPRLMFIDDRKKSFQLIWESTKQQHLYVLSPAPRLLEHDKISVRIVSYKLTRKTQCRFDKVCSLHCFCILSYFEENVL